MYTFIGIKNIDEIPDLDLTSPHFAVNGTVTITDSDGTAVDLWFYQADSDSFISVSIGDQDLAWDENDENMVATGVRLDPADYREFTKDLGNAIHALDAEATHAATQAWETIWNQYHNAA